MVLLKRAAFFLRCLSRRMFLYDILSTDIVEILHDTLFLGAVIMPALGVLLHCSYKCNLRKSLAENFLFFLADRYYKISFLFYFIYIGNSKHSTLLFPSYTAIHHAYTFPLRHRRKTVFVLLNILNIMQIFLRTFPVFSALQTPPAVLFVS